jgi:hypothetical protein
VSDGEKTKTCAFSFGANVENGKTGQERSERQRGPRARAAARGSAKVDERRRDALDSVASWISYPPPPWGECLLAEATTTGCDQGRPRGRQPVKTFGDGDWLANRFSPYLPPRVLIYSRGAE